MRRILLTFLLTLFIRDISAQEYKGLSYVDFFKDRNSIRYTIKPGDTISKILKEKGYKNLHGRGGLIDQTLWKNGISKKDMSQLPVGLEIMLPYRHKKTTKSIRVKPNNFKNKYNRKPANLPTVKNKKRIDNDDIFYLDIGYGLKYFSIEQQGNLGSASIGEITPHFLNLNTGFVNGAFSYFGEFGFSKLKIRSNSNIVDEELSYYNFGVGFHNFFLSVGVEQAPIFRNNSGSIELAKLSTSEVSVGYRSVKKLKAQKETNIRWSLNFAQPVSARPNNNNVKASGFSGYRSKLDVSFEREVSKKDKRHLFYFIKQDIEYRKYNFETYWDNPTGSINYNGVNSSFQIGIRFVF